MGGFPFIPPLVPPPPAALLPPPRAGPLPPPPGLLPPPPLGLLPPPPHLLDAVYCVVALWGRIAVTMVVALIMVGNEVCPKVG